jgi:hypothetical protein
MNKKPRRSTRQLGKDAKRKAAKMAGREIDRLGDQTATREERARRKRQLIKGPPEFRDIRKNKSWNQKLSIRESRPAIRRPDLLMRDEARRIAVNIAKLLDCAEGLTEATQTSVSTCRLPKWPTEIECKYFLLRLWREPLLVGAHTRRATKPHVPIAMLNKSQFRSAVVASQLSWGDLTEAPTSLR